MDKFNQVVDYASTHPNATIRYHASHMVLMKDTDSAYLVLLEAHSRTAGYYYFTNHMIYYSKVIPTPNGPIIIEFKTLKIVVPSSDESKTGGTSKNAQNLIPLGHNLKTVYLHQQTTKGSPVITVNLTYQGILTCLIEPHKNKTWYMRYHWLEDRIFQQHIQLIWKLGINHWAD